MAKGVNKVFLLGNVGKDPEIRSTAGGMAIASFTLATADRQKDAQGNWTDKTEWHNLVAFQRTAEIVRDYVKKGTQIFVEGKIQTRSWDDKESGQKRYKTEILVNELSLLGKPGGGEGGGGGYSKSSSASYGSGAPAAAPDLHAGAGNHGRRYPLLVQLGGRSILLTRTRTGPLTRSRSFIPKRSEQPYALTESLRRTAPARPRRPVPSSTMDDGSGSG